MIVRPASGRGSHICLRCQRGLAKRQNAAASQKASQSTASKPREPSERRLVRRVVDADVEYNINNNFTQGLGNALDYKAFRNGVGGRLHGHRGLQVQENRERLNTTTLGDPADVLVLRDSILTLYAAGGSRAMEEMEPEHIDILSQLEEERGLVGQKEVDRNIDAFRPANERQGWEAINELVKELQDSFTMTQLQRYIRNFEGRRDPEPPIESWVTSQKDAKIHRVTPWLPGVSEIQEYFDNDPLRGYFLPSHTVKQRMVLQLLHECWMLELPELADGIGQFEIEIGKEDMDLLLMGNTSVLDHIHSDHLRHEDEKLEAFRKRSVIRVTAPHVKKPFIVQEIESALNRARTVTISLADLVPQGPDKVQNRRVARWVDRNFDPATLQTLGSLTNTSIVQQQKNMLTISCIDIKQNPLVSPVDVARRLLLTSSKVPDRVEHQLASDAATLNNGAFIRHEVGNTLPWKDRLRDWVRWTAPTSKEAKEVWKPVAVEPFLVSKPMSRQGKGKEQSGSGTASTYWNTKYFTDTSVIFGKVLHSNLKFPESPQIPITFNGQDQYHTFSTQVPNLSRVLSKGQVDRNGERIDSLVLRFLPNPFFKTTGPLQGKKVNQVPVKTRAIGSQAFSAFPAIEMRFDIDRNTKDAVLQDVRAVIHESRTDVMLPHNNTDVRFQQRTTSRLTQRSIKPIRDYIRQSNLKLSGSKLLQTPPSICIPIESHLCRGQGLSLLGEVDSKGNKIPTSTVGEVEYLFAGLEIRSDLSFDYRSWRLRYTSIEAGKAGGRRSELRLCPYRDQKLADEKEFVNMAYELASEFGDQRTGDLVPETLKARSAEADDHPAKMLPTDGPVHNSHPFKYFANKITSESEAPEEYGYRENPSIDVDDVALAGKESSGDVREPTEGMGDSQEATDPQSEEQAAEEMEKDLKKIEDDRI
ncbi:mitochondrial inner-membrane-bound regulator-domain-containing protein [Cadophora sp. MPI-SDFR-AT-0126]|nr:mitochondrial inner-membrane-bound regulator-domain-containing protein [Leotiomycetes sp. MPI-SDFR-AT-0126]